MTTPTRSLGFALLAITLLGCQTEQADPALAFYDRPHSFPAGAPFTGEDVEPERRDAAATAPGECKQGRGLDPEGKCVLLNTQDLPHGGMVQIPAGAFLRGDIPTRFDADADQPPYIHWSGQPLREAVSPGFWMDGLEISRGAYAECVAKGKCGEAKCLDGSDGRPDREMSDADLESFPRTCVTHSQAADYCEWRGARLPSEAEWEFAARGPAGLVFPWGNEVRDEIGQTVGPVGFDPMDISYWGLKGFGGNAREWVADEFDPEANLAAFVKGSFRSEQGPLARAEQAYLRTLVCGADRANDPSCEVPELGKRHVHKGGRVGQRGGAYDFAAGVELASPLPNKTFEQTQMLAQHALLGFRCAKDLAPDDMILESPTPAVNLPLVRQDGNYELFLGVAEAVDRSEAEAFCKVLRAPGDPEDGDAGWRLPTLEEIRATFLWFKGPGPFWTAEGAAEQTFVDSETAEWDTFTSAEGGALLARCIRTL
jgi:formylglycine-generating enzyme required for sulfatase activity